MANLKIRVTCKGKSPILMNPMTKKTLESLLTGVYEKVDKNRSQSEIAEERTIIMDGKIGIPIEYMIGCLKGGGRKVKNGKNQISTATSTTLFSFMEFEDRFLPFKNQKAVMIPDMRMGKLPLNGTAVAIVRPMFEEWEFDVNIILDTAELAESIARQLFEVAGGKIGVGDFRPAKNGPFGRFMVSNWVVLSDDTVKQNGAVKKAEAVA